MRLIGLPRADGKRVTSDLDIYCTANILIKEHGEDAAIFAAMRADELLDEGDLDGQRVA